MDTVVIVIHLMVIVALVAVVLLQRHEGGALGMGGGSDQFMSMRGQGNVLTRATTILGAIFFVTSMAMSILARLNAPPTAILDTAPAAQSAPAVPAPAADTGAAGGSGIMDQLNRYTGGPTGVQSKSVVPDTSAPVAPAGSSSAPAGPQAPAAQ